MDDCLLCRELRGEIDLPGGFMVEDELIAAFHLPPLDNPSVYLGHLLVVTQRHVDHVGELTDAEAARIAVVARQLAAALQASAPIERVHLAVIGTGCPHFHLHVFPRYEGTPADLPWTDVDSWEGAARGAADEAATLVARLRDQL